MRTANCRLAAVRSFFRYAGACEGPDAIAQIQRIMGIPLKRFTRPLLGFLSVGEMQAILNSTDDSWTDAVTTCCFSSSTTPAPVSRRRSQSASRMSNAMITGPSSYSAKGASTAWSHSGSETTRLIRAWLKIAGLKSEQPLLPNRFGSEMTKQP